jgi:tetratricopeptide (TPR) repeat protein
MTDDSSGLVERDDHAMRQEQARRLHDGLLAEQAVSAGDEADRLTERAWRRHRAGEHQAAISLADEAIERDRTLVPAWLCKARCLLALDNVDGAIRLLRAARGQVKDPTELDGLLAWCVERRTGLRVHRARQALRGGRPDEAVALLASCESALGEDAAFRARLTYARERSAGRRPEDSSELGHPQLQSVLAWVCADELRHADRALEAGDFDRAAELYRNALRLDPRFSRAALARARALRDHCHTVDRPESDRAQADSWAASATELGDAARLAEQARDDLALADEAAALLTSIKEDRRRAVKYAGVLDCFARIDVLERYYGRQGTINMWEYKNLCSSFAPIAGDIERLLKRYGRDDPEVGPWLIQLADRAAGYRRFCQRY